MLDNVAWIITLGVLIGGFILSLEGLGGSILERSIGFALLLLSVCLSVNMFANADTDRQWSEDLIVSTIQVKMVKSECTGEVVLLGSGL